ncbi:hypothetical protein DFJ63DRAFT_313936 [Scheffersomyces coipomensis]|uniref:uncharacterized protein n=1 Tax=Scheffersomyces coipomensis TaxID=1788519 RepID=UPI00315DAA12
MKVSTTSSLALASLLVAANAAPIILTQIVTAPAITDLITVTTDAIIKTHTNLIVVYTPPPQLQVDPTTTSPTTTSTAVPTTTILPPPPPTTTSTTTSTPTTTSTTPTTTSTTPTTTSTPTTTTTPTTTSTTPTTTSTTPTTTSTTTTPTTTSTTPTTTSTTPTTYPAVDTTTSSTSTTQDQTTSSTQQGDAFTSDVQFESDILTAHNEKRALHGVPPLVWDNTLTQFAYNYAINNYNCNNVQLIHSGGPYGENLAAGYSGGYDPVDAWYNEISQYDFSDPGFSEATGHFTQVVWKSTSTLGCARITCDNAWGQYTICEYSDTRGNIIGTDPATGLNFFAENVVPPLSSS